jgi:hypothetical protein
MEGCLKKEELRIYVTKFKIFPNFYIMLFLFREKNVIFLLVNYSKLEY